MINPAIEPDDEGLRVAERQKDFYRGISHDMSPAAIDRRLKIVSGLYRLGHQLKNARLLGPGDAFLYVERNPGTPPD